MTRPRDSVIHFRYRLLCLAQLVLVKTTQLSSTLRRGGPTTLVSLARRVSFRSPPSASHATPLATPLLPPTLPPPLPSPQTRFFFFSCASSPPAAMTWMEALPPLVIITVALAGMGTLPDIVHRAAYKQVRGDAPALCLFFCCRCVCRGNFFFGRAVSCRKEGGGARNKERGGWSTTLCAGADGRVSGGCGYRFGGWAWRRVGGRGDGVWPR